MTEIDMRGGVGVLGFGTMGVGIAQVCAAAGYDCIVLETSIEAFEAGLERLKTFLDAGVARGKISPEDREAILARILGVTEAKKLEGVGLIIEAVSEQLAIKLGCLKAVDAVAPSTVIATNTSALSVTEIARHVGNPGRVAGLHFFNPAPIMPLVEVVRSVLTDQSTIDVLMEFSTKIGKSPIEVRDRPGFLVNRLLMPYLNDVAQAYDDGLATAEDIDVALELGLGYPVGPLALLDLIGLDTHHHATTAAYEATKDCHFAPPPILTRMVQAGYLGKKSGEGFRTKAEGTSA
jgi:3-hydroxybutyryl-CoA dehydrogenase